MFLEGEKASPFINVLHGDLKLVVSSRARYRLALNARSRY